MALDTHNVLNATRATPRRNLTRPITMRRLRDKFSNKAIPIRNSRALGEKGC